MTTTETTTRPSENTITRRKMLKSMAAASTAAVILPTSVAASEERHLPEPTALKNLIRNHHRAWRHFEDHCGDADEVQGAYKAQFGPPLIPLSLTPDGQAPSGKLELGVYNPDQILTEIRKTHQALRERHCGNYVKVMAPDQWQAMAAAIDCSEARSVMNLEQMVADEEARQQAFGLIEAQREWDMMSEAEDAAIVAIMRYVPADAAEADEKSAYLRVWYEKGYGFDQHHFEALLEGQGSFPNASNRTDQGEASGADQALVSSFMEWRSEYELSALLPDEREANKHFKQLCAVADRMAEVVPTTVTGFAMKLLALTSYGDFDLDGPAESLLRDAQRIVKMGPPRSR